MHSEEQSDSLAFASTTETWDNMATTHMSVLTLLRLATGKIIHQALEVDSTCRCGFSRALRFELEIHISSSARQLWCSDSSPPTIASKSWRQAGHKPVKAIVPDLPLLTSMVTQSWKPWTLSKGALSPKESLILSR
jgi:hypothetical protein